MLQGFILAFVGLTLGKAVASWALPDDAQTWQQMAVYFVVFLAVWMPGWSRVMHERGSSGEGKQLRQAVHPL